MATTGQTINDRLNAVRYALVGQGLARTVCKATTEEVLGPKKKHLDYLLACTNEPNVSIPQVANLLIERTRHECWTVVFKGLITIHHLMSQGNERFTQYLATSQHSFELNDFLDRITPQGYNMSVFVRRYAKYINDKTLSYRTLALDLCKIRSGNDNALRTMNMENLSKTLPIVQRQFDSLLEFGAEPKDLNNGIIMAAFRLLYKDLVKMYVAYQEAIINLLERYFKLSRRKTREALELYKKYLARMDKVDGFLRVVEAVSLDKSEMPDLTKSPASILKALEDHLAALEAKKRGATTPVSPEHDEQESVAVATPDNIENEPPAPIQQKAADGTVTSGSDKAMQQTERSQTTKAATKVDSSSESDDHAPTNRSGGPVASDRPAPVAPKKPPARPSPKVSPSGSKPPPGAEKKTTPPERPAKPPSRPPPPSSGAGSGSQQTSKTKSPTRPATTPTPPPPPPPPPSAHASTPTAAGTSQKRDTSTKTSDVSPMSSKRSSDAGPQQAPTTTTAIDDKTAASTMNEPDNNEPSEEPKTCSSGLAAGALCSASATETDSARLVRTSVQPTEQDRTDWHETNHVTNNVNGASYEHNGISVANNNAIEPDLPPPPPLSPQAENISDRQDQVDQQEEPVPPPPPPPLPLDEGSGEPQLNGGGEQQQSQNNGNQIDAIE